MAQRTPTPPHGRSERAAAARGPARSEPAAAPPKPPAVAPAWLPAVTLGLAALFLVACFSSAAGDTDTWWHLKTGQYIWQQHRLPVPDPFGWTTYMGKPAYPGEEITRYFNLTHEWLAQVVLYGSYAAAGFRGLVLMRAVALTLFCALAGWIVYRRTRSPYRSLLAGMAPWLVVGKFVSDRPQYFTYVLLALTIAILDDWTRKWLRGGAPEAQAPGARGVWRQGGALWILPPLFLIWANCHGGFILGWVVVGVYCAEDLYRWQSSRVGKLWNPLWAAGLSAILVSGLNPNFYRAIQVMQSYRQSALQSQIWEWKKPIFWEITPYTVLLFGGLAVLLWNRRKTRPVDWLLLAAFGAASLMAYRNIVFAALAGAIIIATYMPEWSGKAGWKSWPLLVLIAVPAAIGAQAQVTRLSIVILLACMFLIWKGPDSRMAEAVLALWFAAVCGYVMVKGAGFQLYAEEWKLPTATADFLIQHRITGRMFNTYQQGGYLIWRLSPQLQVFVDGRALNESVYADSARINMNAASGGGKSGEELLKDYNIDLIVMDAFDYIGGAAFYLPAALADPAQKEWKLVFHDMHDVVYMRHPPPDVPVLSSFDALASMEEQCVLYAKHGEPACAGGLVDIFTRVGDRDRARKWAAFFRGSNYKPAFTVVK